MKIKDSIKYAGELLSMTEVVSALNGSGTGELNPNAATELNDLISCAHGVVREIAGEYAQVFCTESALVEESGRIPYSAFSHNAIEITDIRYGEKSIRFQSVYGGVRVDARGSCAVTYAYLPLISGLEDSVEFSNPKIDARIVGFGIAAEYCMREGMTDEAVLWDRRYKDALTASGRVRREQRVKARRWI